MTHIANETYATEALKWSIEIVAGAVIFAYGWIEAALIYVVLAPFTFVACGGDREIEGV